MTNSGGDGSALTRQREPCEQNISNAGAAAAARRRLPVGERRDELINAALELLGSRPAIEVSMDGGHTGVAGPMGPAGKIGKIGEGVRQVVPESILKALGIAVPGPVLCVTLRCWLACAEAAGLDWPANRDLPRDTLERMRTEQLVALLRVAATRGAQITELLEQLLADA